MAGLTLISGEQVTQLLDLKQLLTALEQAMGRLAMGPEGGVVQPVRTTVLVERNNGCLLGMPGYSREDDALACKMLTVFPDNAALGLPTIHAYLFVFDPINGKLQALIDGESVTAARTGVASAVATKHLANPKSKILAILGSGVQARSHYTAMCLLFDFQEVRLWSRTKANGVKCAEEIGAKLCGTVEEAVKDADIICVCIMCERPILQAGWVKEGAHINSVGANNPHACEIEAELMKSAIVYADSRDACLKESGDVILSEAEIYAEIGEVVIGKKKAQPEKTTIFKSMGMAIEDVVCAKLVMDKYKDLM